MKKIPLTRGFIATVCDCHAHLVENNKWQAQQRNNNTWCARRSATAQERRNGAPSHFVMHIVINQTPKGMDTDHIDRDTMNNQCSNLRTATKSQNLANTVSYKGTSGYKGVSFESRRKHWIAYIAKDKKQFYLGSFTDPKEAAKKYDEKARELYGDFARTNF